MDPGNIKQAFVYDFGQNIAGYSGLDTLVVPPQSTIILRHAELLGDDNQINNIYCGYPCVCGGDGGNCANQVRIVHVSHINFY